MSVVVAKTTVDVTSSSSSSSSSSPPRPPPSLNKTVSDSTGSYTKEMTAATAAVAAEVATTRNKENHHDVVLSIGGGSLVLKDNRQDATLTPRTEASSPALSRDGDIQMMGDDHDEMVSSDIDMNKSNESTNKYDDTDDTAYDHFPLSQTDEHIHQLDRDGELNEVAGSQSILSQELIMYKSSRRGQGGEKQEDEDNQEEEEEHCVDGDLQLSQQSNPESSIGLAKRIGLLPQTNDEDENETKAEHHSPALGRMSSPSTPKRHGPSVCGLSLLTRVGRKEIVADPSSFSATKEMIAAENRPKITDISDTPVRESEGFGSLLDAVAKITEQEEISIEGEDAVLWRRSSMESAAPLPVSESHDDSNFVASPTTRGRKPRTASSTTRRYQKKPTTTAKRTTSVSPSRKNLPRKNTTSATTTTTSSKSTKKGAEKKRKASAAVPVVSTPVKESPSKRKKSTAVAAAAAAGESKHLVQKSKDAMRIKKEAETKKREAKKKEYESKEEQAIAKSAAALAERIITDPILAKRLLLSMALVRENPRLPPDVMPGPGHVIPEGFFWAHYPALEHVLKKHMAEYYELSTTKCQSAQQQSFNNDMVVVVKEVANARQWKFADCFDDKTLRDRIRCYYKTHIQNAKKRLRTMVRNPTKRANSRHLMQHLHLIEQHKVDQEKQKKDRRGDTKSANTDANPIATEL